MNGFRALIFRGGAIGDSLLTLPVLQCLRQYRPQGRIEFAGYPGAVELALAGGLADRGHSLEDAAMASLFSRDFEPGAMRPDWREFDLVLSYLHDPMEVVRANLERATGHGVLTCSPLVSAGHAIDHFLQPLRALGIALSGREYAQLALPAAAAEGARKVLAGFGARVVILHPGSGARRKNWPLTKYLELAARIRQELHLTPVLSLGEAEEAMVDPLRGAAPRWPVLTGLSLVQLAAALSVCHGYVGNDSGITHLAAAVGVPVVSVFGPTDPCRWAPRGPNVRVVRSVPASDGGLQALPVAEVWRAVCEFERDGTRKGAYE